MSHSSEDRLHESSSEAKQTSARILPFQRPPTDLQRAVQARAQETMERERERERERTKPAPLRWAIIFVLALVPVLGIVLGVDAFVRAFHVINDKYSKMPVPQAQSEEAPLTSSEPGVVLLQPLSEDNEASKSPPSE